MMEPMESLRRRLSGRPAKTRLAIAVGAAAMLLILLSELLPAGKQPAAETERSARRRQPRIRRPWSSSWKN